MFWRFFFFFFFSNFRKSGELFFVACKWTQTKTPLFSFLFLFFGGFIWEGKGFRFCCSHNWIWTGAMFLAWTACNLGFFRGMFLFSSWYNFWLYDYNWGFKLYDAWKFSRIEREEHCVFDKIVFDLMKLHYIFILWFFILEAGVLLFTYMFVP